MKETHSGWSPIHSNVKKKGRNRGRWGVTLFSSMVLAYLKTCWLAVLEVFYNEVLWLSGPVCKHNLYWSLELLSILLAENFLLHKLTHTLRVGFSPIKSQSKVERIPLPLLKKTRTPYPYQAHKPWFSDLSTALIQMPSRKLFNANHLSWDQNLNSGQLRLIQKLCRCFTRLQEIIHGLYSFTDP